MNYEKLRKEMERQRISTRQLAIKAGIVPQNLYAAVNGRTTFWPSWKRRVAEALSVDADYLFSEGPVKSDEGEWLIWLNNFGYIQVKCSKCGYRVTSDEQIPNVCPKCGAINIKSNE